MNVFTSADILLPDHTDMEKWAVIAVDQFVSQPGYWQQARAFVGDAPSTLHMVWPEAELEDDAQTRITAINRTMARYLDQQLFRLLPQSYILVERTLQNGTVRRGVVGAVDLEHYDYTPGVNCAVRATEKTVTERIPPRVTIRQDAPIELPHVLLLCDDPGKTLIESISTEALPLLYDFELMQGGGRIRGWLMADQAAQNFTLKVSAYEAAAREHFAPQSPVFYAVGDGNHSLAAAKVCYESRKQAGDPGLSRYALVELENIHDPALEFEPIHRIIKNTDPDALLVALQAHCAPGGAPVRWFSGSWSGTVELRLTPGQLEVGALQSFLDDYLENHPGETDYIHGDDALQELAQQPDAIGFLLPAMEKSSLFPGILADGVLPRKTFSMGHAQEKRYYLEARRIRES